MQNFLNSELQEITDLKTEARSAQNKLRSFFESSGVIHLLIGTDCRLIDFNRAAEAFAKKYCKVNIKVGTKVSRLLHKDQLSSFMQNYNKALEGIPVRMEQEFKYALKAIAYIHSHHFRAPVTNIMGLMNIFKANGYRTTKAGLLMMQRAVNELEVQMNNIEEHMS
ncbi:PAS domain-containing protein [Pedobacter africanus]|uniref:PAS domain-containing protein n=1 Tax=Pedobacter africanus TaxID=151894 RepID=A0ACC6KU73_9SPHI|nr:PAS domain-containing protein [Pedobacter africanus]